MILQRHQKRLMNFFLQVRRRNSSTNVPATQTKLTSIKQQSVNRDKVWSPSQNPREIAMCGPRFEQTLIEFQPAPLAAIELIANEPVRYVEDRIVSCNGGGGPLGHPKVFVNLDGPGAHTCGYCGLRFARHEHHH